MCTLITPTFKLSNININDTKKKWNRLQKTERFHQMTSTKGKDLFPAEDTSPCLFFVAGGDCR